MIAFPCPSSSRIRGPEDASPTPSRAPGPDGLRGNILSLLPRDATLPIVKRWFDIFAALAALILFSPVLAVVAAIVRVQLGSPVIFRQQRPGRQGRPFSLLKFRTMSDNRGPDGELLPDALRLTALGNFLRSTSLDELPELWNVLRGEMSLVGPRPLLTEYLPLYNSRQSRRHEVRPGVTGWAQVNGRNALGWEERLELDVWYVDHRTVWLDMAILLRTIVAVGQRRGVSQPGHATMEKFRGGSKPPLSGP
ncbi:MAG TPA: sugar transferase [Candidatus Didemnitutus sp.]|nr:sugar transferase [Candidatus Didemnitutus sp.]